MFAHPLFQSPRLAIVELGTLGIRCVLNIPRIPKNPDVHNSVEVALSLDFQTLLRRGFFIEIRRGD